MKKAWRGFTGTKWLDEVNMRQFIQDNYDSYDGDASFLEKPTEATDKLWGMLKELQKQERAKGGVLDMDVYDLAEWCCIAELSKRSIEQGSMPVMIPDFVNRRSSVDTESL